MPIGKQKMSHFGTVCRVRDTLSTDISRLGSTNLRELGPSRDRSVTLAALS